MAEKIKTKTKQVRNRQKLYIEVQVRIVDKAYVKFKQISILKITTENS